MTALLEDDGNAAFGELHEAIGDLTAYLNDEGEADGETDPAEGLRQVQSLADQIYKNSLALTVADFEEEYPEDADADAIDAEVVNYG